jgi:hypothetical protein
MNRPTLTRGIVVLERAVSPVISHSRQIRFTVTLARPFLTYLAIRVASLI